MGPLLIGGGGGGGSSFFKEDPEVVVFRPLLADWEGVRVAEESIVDFLDTASEPERELDSVVGVDAVTKGLGAEAKFLNEGSDIRGAFQGNRRIAIQLLLTNAI
jgi:hypothetical protein